MKLSRVTKWKEYRDSFTKEDAFNLGNANDIISGLSDEELLSGSTNTLPYNEVMNVVNEEEQIDLAERKERFDRIFKISLLAIIGVALTVGLIFLGILAFKG